MKKSYWSCFCSVFVLYLFCRALTDRHLTNILRYRKNEDTKLVLQKITDNARQITGFESLPVTAQVSMLYHLIEEAQSHRIPLKMICKAFNDAGSTCSVQYFRAALFVARQRIKKGVIAPAGIQTPSPGRTTLEAPPQSAQADSEGNSGLTQKQRRDAKADSYSLSDSNPLLIQFNSKE